MLENMEKTDYYVNDSEQSIYSGATVSKNGVVYFPFIEEKETIDWIDDMVGQWWDDEAI
ncbi:MAG: hypothetical protein FWF55_01740 [Treponema sp.]|nr:hypothetical protein [Treponema sp.]